MKKSEKMPLLGIGPIYVLTCLFLTIFGLYLDKKDLLNLGKFNNLKIIMFIVGMVLIAIGIVIYIYAVFFQKILKEIKDNNLVTNGVYGLVRNPVYSAFFLVFTGILFIANNLFLLILPFIFWLYLTILLKLTEEKWLINKFGDEYIQYCKDVNRVIPWFRR